MTRFSLSLCVVATLTLTLADQCAAQQGVQELLTSAYQKTQVAQTVADFTAVIDLCHQAEASSLSPEQGKYAKQLLAWAYNRRGEAFTEQAATALEAGDTVKASSLDTKALSNFEEAITHDPVRWKALHNRGVSYALIGKYEPAIADFSRVIELRPDYPNAWFNRGEIRYELGQFEQALGDYSKALEFQPDDLGAQTGRGHTHFRLRQFSEALADYTRVVELNPDSAEAYAHRGDAYQSLAMWKEAAADFRKVIELEPQSPRGYAGAAWIMSTCPDEHFRNSDLGIQAARRALELGSKHNYELLDTLAAAYANAAQFEEAIAAVSQAIKLAPAPAAAPLAKRLELYNSERPYRQVAGQSEPIETANRNAR